MHPTLSFRRLCFILSCVAATHVALAADAPMKGDASQETLVYVGTYTGAKSKGIYLFRLPASGATAPNNQLVPMGLAVETQSPSFLAVDAKRRLVFAANETSRFDGKPTGAVSSFSVDRATGKLTLINQRSSMGAGPCHLALDPSGKNLIVANYNSGSIAVLPVAANGTLGEASDVIQNTGKSVHPNQTGPHAHCVTFDPAGGFVFICDLGLDKVLAYRLDAAKGKLTPADPAFTATAPGAGPRHLVFRPDAKFAYVVNELNATVGAYAYDAKTGKMTEVQTASTLPAGYEGRKSCAEIAVHPSGKWLYASNRGHDSIALFAIDAGTGKLTFVETQSTGGKTPRNFAIHPDGKYLTVANQDSDTMFVRPIDEATGKLKPAVAPIETPAPVCIVFLAPAR